MNASADVGLEDRNCPLGCPRGDAPVLAGRDRLQSKPGEFTVVRCATCGLMRTNPRPSPQSMPFYYGDDYARLCGAPMHEATHRTWVDRLLGAEALPRRAPGRLLEIGCGSGGFLRRMAAVGWDVAGIDSSEAAAAVCRAAGLRVHAGPLETAPPPPKPVDLVVGWMALEHLHEPVACLARLLDWTRDDGMLVLSVPDAACVGRRIFGDAWFALHLPNHLYHFTPVTLAAVLAGSGWQIERLRHQPNLSDYFGSAGQWLEDRRSMPTIARALAAWPRRGGRANVALLPAAWLAALLGQAGRMTVWARKRAIAPRIASSTRG